MTNYDDTAQILRRTTAVLTAPALVPTAASVLAAADRRRDRRRALTVGVSACVAAAVLLATDLVLLDRRETLSPAGGRGTASAVPSPARVPFRPEYTGSRPELGQAPSPLSVIDGDRIATGGTEPPADPQDLLAQVQIGQTVHALFGIRKNGRRCALTGLKRPSYSQIAATACPSGGDAPPLSEQPVTVIGDGPGRMPSPEVSPGVIYGGVPAGTRYVRLERPGTVTVTVEAYDAGDAYDHRAYFAARWNLQETVAPTVVTALTGSGEVVAQAQAGGRQN